MTIGPSQLQIFTSLTHSFNCNEMDEELQNDSIFDISGNVDNPDSDAFFEDSFSNVVPGTSTSTPKPKTVTGNKSKCEDKSEKLKCPKCPSIYANRRTLDTHLRGHFMKGVTSRVPTKVDLMETMGKLLKESIDSIIQEKALGEFWEKTHEYCKVLSEKLEDPHDPCKDFSCFLCDTFLNLLKSSKVLFPSAIRMSMYSGTNKILNDDAFRRSVIGYLVRLVSCDREVVNVVCSDIVFRLSQKVAVYSMRKMRGNISECEEVRSKKSEDNIQSLTFQQLSHFIGGSIVAGYIWKGQRYSKNSEMWTLYLDVLKKKFVCDEKERMCSENVRVYTEARDRGGLLYLCNEAFDFFLILFDVIMSCEGESGSLPPDVINTTILENDVLLCLWDVLVGNDLAEEKSLHLLIRIAHSCTRVVSKGILTRRLNDAMPQSHAAVAHRARLAR